MNAANLIDFYKADHRRQYPEGTTLIYSNFTPRKSRIDGIDRITCFGLRYLLEEYLSKYWNKNFFHLPKNIIVNHYKFLMEKSLGKDAIPDFKHIEDLHDLGYLPIEIKAIPEGNSVGINVPILTIKNTLPKFYWITNYLETMISAIFWKPCTTATIARTYRENFNRYAKETCDDLSFTPFQGHDFSFRGLSGIEDALINGAAHLLSFQGTDTVPALDFIYDNYGWKDEDGFLGGSVAATEHSVMSMGLEESEFETYKRLITEVYPKGIVSIVSDTYDFWQVITGFLPSLKEQILNRDGKLVIRPDSGIPEKIICGDLEVVSGEPEHKGAIECIWDIFKGTLNSKGYRKLDSHIGLIYGDSITLDVQKKILEGLKRKGFSTDCVVLGIGSYTYNYTTRDTFGFAMKATYGEINGEPREIFKMPKTGAWKKSHRGLLKVVSPTEVKQQCSWEEEKEGLLETVFKDGYIIKLDDFYTIRQRVLYDINNNT